MKHETYKYKLGVITLTPNKAGCSYRARVHGMHTSGHSTTKDRARTHAENFITQHTHKIPLARHRRAFTPYGDSGDWIAD